MAVEIVELHPPLGGLRRDAGYAQKPPFHFEDGVNVRVFDVLENRGRIGSRPGLNKYFQTQLLGAEVILNGGFAGSTDWTALPAPSWSFTDGVAKAIGTLGSLAQTVDPLESGEIYLVTFTVSNYTAGLIAAWLGPDGYGTLRSSNGTFTESIRATGAGFQFYLSSTFRGWIDNVTVKKQAPIRLASVIRTFNDSGMATFEDEFLGTAMTSSWTAASWTVDGTASAGLPLVDSGQALLTNDNNSETRGALLNSVTDVSTTAFRSVASDVALQHSVSGKERLKLYMDLDNAALSESSGLIVVLDGASGGWTISLYVDGVLVASPVSFANGVGNRLEMSIDTANLVTVKFQGVTRFAYTAMGYTPPAASRFGFALRKITPATPFRTPINNFSIAYTSTAGGSPPEAAVFSASGALYRETTSGVLTVVTPTPTSMNLASDRRIWATARLDKLYIADYGIRRERLVKSADATVVDVSGTQARLDDSSVSDWTALGIEVGGDVLEILDATTTVAPTSPATALGVYNIASIHATNGITFDRSNAWTASSVAYRIMRYPKIFDAGLNTLTRVTLGTLGSDQFPAGYQSVVLWSDRLVWSNNTFTPHVWIMSAAGFPNDYDFGDTSLGVGASVNGTQSEFAGMIGEPLVTTIPINDDYLVFACRTSFYVLRGNPRLGGTMDAISREIGIVDIGAWCRTPEGKLYVLTLDGLYELSLSGVTPVSRPVIPKELLGLKSDLYDVSLNYDVERRGVLISAVGKELSVDSVHYSYFEPTGAFLPERTSRDHDATATVNYQPGGISTPIVLWGSRDAYVRRLEDTAQSDDGTNFDSFVLYGPIRLGGSDYGDGYLHEIVCVMDVFSGSVTLSVHGGHTAQAAKTETARYSTTMTAGRNRNRYPRLRYGVVYIKVTGTPGSKWVMESLTVTRERAGRLMVT